MSSLSTFVLQSPIPSSITILLILDFREYVFCDYERKVIQKTVLDIDAVSSVYVE